MLKHKFLPSLVLVFVILLTQVSTVAATPRTQDTAPVEVTQIETETDASGVTTVLVTFLLEDQTTQTVRLSLEYATQLGLFDAATQQPVAIEDLPDTIVIDPNEIIADEGMDEPEVHLISALLADFFFDGDPDMANLIDRLHTGDNDADHVFGFGLIAQALWMSQDLNDGTASAGLAEEILSAKRSGDYSAFELADGSSPSNWGQFKKALRENKEKHNLGVIVSGQADDNPGVGDPEDEVTDPTLGDQEDDKEKEKEKEKNKDKDHGNRKDKQKRKNKP